MTHLRQGRRGIGADATAVVLAGGGSRRMGRDKARISYRGRSLLEHVVDAAHSVASRVLVVGGSAEVPRGCQHVADRFPGEGPLGAIISALPHVATPWCLVLACDTPLVSPALLGGLVAVARAHGHAEAVMPCVGGRVEPLVALYRASLAARLEGMFQGGERSLGGMCRGLVTVLVDEEALRAWDVDLDSFVNVNAPEDLASLRARGTPGACDSG